MQTVYLLLAFLCLIYLVYLLQPDLKKKKINSGRKGSKSTTEGLYMRMRNMAFSVTPEKLKINIPGDDVSVYGVIVDWSYSNVIASVVAFTTGDASIYLSSDQIFIGGYAHEEIKKAAKDLVVGAQYCLGLTQKTLSLSLPDKECTKFYFLTNKGIYSHQEPTISITQGESDWTVIFNITQNLIAQYRLIDQAKRKGLEKS